MPKSGVDLLIQSGLSDRTRNSIYRWLSVIYDFFQPDLNEVCLYVTNIGWLPGTLNELAEWLGQIEYFMEDSDSKGYLTEVVKGILANRQMLF